jgi:NAD(P)-dependent dehydrogenase (short-subunit alcohol dehydrogenase family)
MLQVSIRQFADPQARLEEICKGLPMGRPTEPVDVAMAAVYLASDEANYVTGTSLEVDGGRGV